MDFWLNLNTLETSLNLSCRDVKSKKGNSSGMFSHHNEESKVHVDSRLEYESVDEEDYDTE